MIKSPDKSASEINHIQWVALDTRRQIHSQDHLGCLIRLSGVEKYRIRSPSLMNCNIINLSAFDL